MTLGNGLADYGMGWLIGMTLTVAILGIWWITTSPLKHILKTFAGVAIIAMCGALGMLSAYFVDTFLLSKTMRETTAGHVVIMAALTFVTIAFFAAMSRTSFMKSLDG